MAWRLIVARTLKGCDPKAAKPSKPKILIYGKAGVGKTWTSLDFPGVYYIDTEGGANLKHYTDKLHASGGSYLGPSDGSNDFSTVLNEIVSLATTKHNFRTLVIDSYSKLFNTCIDVEYERMERSGRDMSKTFGAEKKPSIYFTRRMIRWFEKLDMNVIMVCHEKPQWFGGEQVGVTFDGWDKLEYELHLALQIVKQGNSRKAKVTKSRLEEFRDGLMFDWSYPSFAKLWGQDVIEKQPESISLASDEQVSVIKSLIESVRVDQKIIEKWLEKAGADRFEDMDAISIQKCINHLTNKIPNTQKGGVSDEN